MESLGQLGMIRFHLHTKQSDTPHRVGSNYWGIIFEIFWPHITCRWALFFQ